MRIILHIGTDKTGSTAIQQHVTLNRDWLAAKLVFVPMSEFDRDIGHVALLNGFAHDKVRQLNAELAEAEQAGFRVAILSWEGMNFYPLKDIKYLGSILTGHEISILVYLREQADIIQTGFLQEHKSLSGTLSLRVIESPQTRREKLLRKAFLHTHRRDYYRLLRRWQRGLPEARLVARIYAGKLLKNGSVVDDFIEQLGLSMDDRFERSSRPSNISLDVESALLIDRWHQNPQLSDIDLRRRVDIALSVIANNGGGSKYFLSKDNVKAIRSHFRASNVKLASAFLKDQANPFSLKYGCWRETDFEGIVERADKRARLINEIDETPTLKPLGSDMQIPPELELRQGWQNREKWGAWSDGPISRIQFRVWRRHITANCVGIRIFLRGRYYGDNKSTLVEINGHNFGEHILDRRHSGLELPEDWLLPFEMVDITLKHKAPVSPKRLAGDEDKRVIAYGLLEIGYVYLWRGTN